MKVCFNVKISAIREASFTKYIMYTSNLWCRSHRRLKSIIKLFISICKHVWNIQPFAINVYLADSNISYSSKFQSDRPTNTHHLELSAHGCLWVLVWAKQLATDVFAFRIVGIIFITVSQSWTKGILLSGTPDSCVKLQDVQEKTK